MLKAQWRIRGIESFCQQAACIWTSSEPITLPPYHPCSEHGHHVLIIATSPHISLPSGLLNLSTGGGRNTAKRQTSTQKGNKYHLKSAAIICDKTQNHCEKEIKQKETQ